MVAACLSAVVDEATAADEDRSPAEGCQFGEPLVEVAGHDERDADGRGFPVVDGFLELGQRQIDAEGDRAPACQFEQQAENQGAAFVALALERADQGSVGGGGVLGLGLVDHEAELAAEEAAGAAFLVDLARSLEPAFADFDEEWFDDPRDAEWGREGIGEALVGPFGGVEVGGQERGEQGFGLERAGRWGGVEAAKLGDDVAGVATGLGFARDAAEQFDLSQVVAAMTGGRAVGQREAVAAFPDAERVATDAGQLADGGDAIAGVRAGISLGGHGVSDPPKRAAASRMPSPIIGEKPNESKGCQDGGLAAARLDIPSRLARGRFDRAGEPA